LFLVACCGAALVPSVICDAVTNLRQIGTYRAPLFSASASAETRQYRAENQFFQTYTARMIVALESISLATTGALKCRILW
jgi:hypothetical protein